MKLDTDLALEMLCLCRLAERVRSDDMDTTASPTSTFLNADPANPPRPIRVNGSPVRNPVAISATSPKIDTECVVVRSDDGDVVVAFRSSEPPGGLFEKNGSFRDWVTTDFRAQRVVYPPDPGPLHERRWVHAGFWDAFEPIAARLRQEVKRKAAIAGTRAVYVTGFSLGGALALLAALDLAEALPQLPVHLWSIAAPRCGDASLNGLLARRTASATSIGWRGDPTPHLPPVGPNFPVTMVAIAKVEIGGFHIPIGNPSIPQLGQQYRTPGRLFYIDEEHRVHDAWPPLQVALNFLDHDFWRYRDALRAVREAQQAAEAAPVRGRIEGVLLMMMSGAAPA
jgi:hypothetical protein